MNRPRLFSLILALVLFAAAPALGQIIPRGGGGGGGGGGDASAANQTTQISALPLEDVAHVTGDRGSFSLGVENSDLTAFTAGDKDYTPFGVTSLGQMIDIPMLSAEIATANQLGKAEDVLHVTGDAGIPGWGVQNESLFTFGGAVGDYTPKGVDRFGASLSVLVHNPAGVLLESIQVSKQEDDAHATGDAGIPSWNVANESLATFATTGDYIPRGSDRTGAAFSVPLVSDFISINRQLGKIEDFPAPSGQSGVPAFLVRADTPASSSATNNDWVYMISDSTGHAWTHEFEVGSNDFSIDRDNITTASVNIAFGFTSNKIEIRAATGNAGDICVDWAGGTAACPSANTAGDYRLEAGQILLLDSAAYSSVSIIASTGTNTVNISAWN